MIQFLETFVDRHFTGFVPQQDFDVLFGVVQIAMVRNEIQDPCTDRLGSVVRNQFAFFHLLCNEPGQQGQVGTQVQFAGKSLNERERGQGTEFRFVGGLHRSLVAL